MASELSKVPPAKSLLYGLRSIGYSFSSALADIIDNSVTAEASNIEIWSESTCAEPYVAILDDGYGMGYKDLDNAMTLGSDRSEKDLSFDDLGKFGLGLKSASFSQCLKLTVASKKFNKVNAMRYDLQKISDRDKWIVDVLDEDEIQRIPQIQRLLDRASGTIVVWQNFDRLNDETNDFNKSFASAISDAELQIAFIFHNFYDQIKITFNGHRVPKRDPFLIDSPKTQKPRPDEILVPGYEEPIIVTPYVLPFANGLTQEEKALLGNPKRIGDDQGFYLYRNNRLIVWGSWLHMGYGSDFNKLARVRIDFSSECDNLWTLDVKKSSAKIPDCIKDRLRGTINAAIGKSDKTIRHRGVKELQKDVPIWDRFKSRDGEVTYKINKNNELYNSFSNTLSYEQKEMFDAYLNVLENNFPVYQLSVDYNDNQKITNTSDNEKEEELFKQTVLFVKAGADLDQLLKMDMFACLRERKNDLLEALKDGDK